MEKNGPNKLEKKCIKARRSIHTSRNIKKGEILRFKDIIIKRPGLGFKPRDLKKILNKKVKKIS